MNPGALGLGIVFVSLVAGCGALYLLQYLYGRREKPGAGWFMGNIAAVAGFCIVYASALFIFQPTARLALEAITIVCVAFMGPFFLAFGLDYTGRGDLIRTPLFLIVALVPVLTTVLAATNPFHRFVWTNFRFDPLFGLATVQYSFQPWGTFALLFSIGTAAVGSLLLIGAVLSYGPLYRREAVATTLSTAPPSIGVFLWLFGLGPVPQLHLTAPLMVLHIALDAYAFVGTHMFETNPATQRMAERTGLDSLSDPVVVLDPAGRIVRVNDRADALFMNEDVSFSRSLDAVFDTTLSTLREDGELTVDDAGNRTFAVSYTPLTDVTDESVGSMLVFYDITVSESDADATVIEIRDPNEPIPEIELASLRTGDETSLQHGQGIGLWIVYWCVSTLQGEIDFAYDDGNTIAVTLPELSAD